jgi:UDP-N-acetyl-D-glucosamine dehydrogenase
MASSYQTQLLERIAAREARVGIVGVGYVGLPLAVVFAEAGFHVTGIDLSAERVAQINAGSSYIADIPSEAVARLRAEGRIDATTDFSALAQMDAISICVPTPLRQTRDPDISFIANVTEQIARHLRPGQVIVLESTTYPGTTREPRRRARLLPGLLARTRGPRP